jgi:hypothetical protein
VRKLPTFKGYTVDERLREFRKVEFEPERRIEFIPFDSEQGRELLQEFEEAESPTIVAFKNTEHSDVSEKRKENNESEESSVEQILSELDVELMNESIEDIEVLEDEKT